MTTNSGYVAPTTKPYKAIIAFVGTLVTGLAAAWPAGDNITVREGVTALLLSVVTSILVYVKSNPPA